MKDGDSGIGFSTLTRRPLGVNFQLGCFEEGRGSLVESEKGKNRPKSHRVESREFKSWKWEFNFNSSKQEQTCT